MKYTDREVFTTGPRRSFCLLQLVPRHQEQYDQLRERMRKVVTAVQAKGVSLSGMKKPLWATFSKPKSAQERSGHCGAICTAVYHFAPDKITELDADYVAGTCWLGNSKLEGASSRPENTKGILTIEHQTCRPWVDFVALSKELQADEEELGNFFRGSTN